MALLTVVAALLIGLGLVVAVSFTVGLLGTRMGLIALVAAGLVLLYRSLLTTGDSADPSETAESAD